MLLVAGSLIAGGMLSACGSDSTSAGATPASAANAQGRLVPTIAVGMNEPGVLPSAYQHGGSGSQPLGTSPSSSTPVTTAALMPAGTSASSASSSSGGSSGSSGGAVTQSAPGTVTLSWQPPTEYTDGTAMGNLAGYHIHYGAQPTNLTSSINVANPGLATYLVQGLSPGTYYFALSAYDSTGAESDDSEAVAVTVN